MSAKSLTFMVMAAGTGGHVYPALSFAEQARANGHTVYWLGTESGLEARVVPAAGFELLTLTIEGIRGRGLVTLLKAPVVVGRAILQSIRLLRRIKPDLVIGFGGYIAGPAGVAARLMKRPLVIHEQNARPGTTNRLLSKVATLRLCGFANALPGSIHVGNPVRAQILAGSGNADPMTRKPRQVRLLILGGSLGALFLNKTLPAVLGQIAESERPLVRHQCGRGWEEETAKAYGDQGIDIQIEPFIERMDEAYQWADIVVCRAGAMTVSELATAGLASILVPFPHAIDDHQTANAKVLESAGAAVIYQQREDDPGRLKSLLTELVSDPAKIERMALAAKTVAIEGSAERILALCENLCLTKRGHYD